MPLYLYKCRNCNKEIEVEHSYNQNLSDVLSEDEVGCRISDFYKVIGNVGVVYKGEGFTRKEDSLKNNGIPKEVWKNLEDMG